MKVFQVGQKRTTDEAVIPCSFSAAETKKQTWLINEREVLLSSSANGSQSQRTNAPIEYDHGLV